MKTLELITPEQIEKYLLKIEKEPNYIGVGFLTKRKKGFYIQFMSGGIWWFRKHFYRGIPEYKKAAECVNECIEGENFKRKQQSKEMKAKGLQGFCYA
jgi:hypothetical protein